MEQRQFRSIYQLNATGFVASTDHFNWPKKTREVILDSYKEDGWALSGHALRPNTAGRPETSQMITWGALDYLYAKDSESLVAMLDELARSPFRRDRLEDQPGSLRRPAGSDDESACRASGWN